VWSFLLFAGHAVAGPIKQAQFEIDLPDGWKADTSVEAALVKGALEQEGMHLLASLRHRGGLAVKVAELVQVVSDAEVRHYQAGEPAALAEDWASALTKGGLRVATASFDPDRMAFVATFEPNAVMFCAQAQFLTRRGFLFVFAYSQACGRDMPQFEAVVRRTTIPAAARHPAQRPAPRTATADSQQNVHAIGDDATQTRLAVQAQIDRKKGQGLTEPEAARYVLGGMLGHYLMDKNGKEDDGVLDADLELVLESERAYLEACGRCAPAAACSRDRLEVMIGRGSDKASPCAETPAPKPPTGKWSKQGWGKLRWGMTPTDVPANLALDSTEPYANMSDLKSELFDQVFAGVLAEPFYGRRVVGVFFFDEHGLQQVQLQPDRGDMPQARNDCWGWFSSIRNDLLKRYGEPDKGGDSTCGQLAMPQRTCQWVAEGAIVNLEGAIRDNGRCEITLRYVSYAFLAARVDQSRKSESRSKSADRP
jgi:hypothetical protein